MKLVRKIQLMPRIIIKLATNNKYYICDKCKKIHKREGKEFDLNENWSITVNNKCANETIENSYDLITKAIFTK